MIKAITASNLAFRTFAYPLAPLTIFHGRNAVGKSTIKDAILLAASGKHPDAPASAAGIMEAFGTGPSLTVAIETAKGTLSRTWTRSGKTVKASVLGDATLGESITPAFFSGRAFLSAKPADRANMIRAAYPTTEDPKESVLEAIAAAGGATYDIDNKLPFDAWVEAYIEAAKEDAKGHRANEKRMKGVIQGLVQLDTDDGLDIPVSDAEIAAASLLHQQANQRLGAANATLQALMEKSLDVVPDEPQQSIPDILTIQAEKDSALKSIQAEIDGASATNTAARTAYVKAKAEFYEAKEKHDDATAVLDQALEAAATYGIDHNNAATALETALSGKSVEEATEAIKELRMKCAEAAALAASASVTAATKKANWDALKTPTHGDECITCGSHREHWNDLVLDAVRQAAIKAEEASLAATKESDAATGASAIYAKQLARLEAELLAGGCRIAAAKCVLEAVEALVDAPNPGDFTTVPPADIDLDDKQSQAYHLECELQDLRTALDDWKIINEQGLLAQEITTASREVDEAQAEVAETLETQQAKASMRDTQASRRQDAAKTEQATKELADATEALAKAENTASIVESSAKAEALKALEPILTIAATFTDGILSPPITNNGLAVGRWHGASWQPINRLSGAEQTMVIAAIAAALATGSTSKIVVIDEFSVLDDAWKPLFLANLRKAHEAGQIEQAIILDNREITAEGWTTTSL